ncbi:MAG: hypothetical protein HY062_11190 [Bacteroidetes bacterium]|nr:hypothetical protein [Bacteroidota bacterium]
MKTIPFLIIGLLISIRSFSQDTLYTTQGQTIAGKVTEINSEDIKYKKSSNLDGPTYVISKADVVMIEYKNGSKDVFTKNNNSATSQSNTNNGGYNTSSTQVFVTPRPSINVVVGPTPFYGFNPWGWAYRPHFYFRGGYGGFHGGYGGYHGGGGFHGGGFHGGGHHR